MMKTKLLNLLSKKVMELTLIVLVPLICTTCRGQVSIYSDIKNIEATHKIKNFHVKEIINFMLRDKSFENWEKDQRKWLIVSAIKRSEDTIIRVIPRLKAKFSIPSLPNDYSAYLVYKEVIIVYWGDEKLFFESTGNKLLTNLFEPKEEYINQKDEEGNSIIVISNDEYYGCEFIIKDDKLSLIEKKYFGSPVIEQR
jgi:hypothetical protein|nr:hypothetical protein [uncultured Flavobacterium sp.]